MRNLALRDEVRHVLPLPARQTRNDGIDDSDSDDGGGASYGSIVAVIPNANADLHGIDIDPSRDADDDRYADDFPGGGADVDGRSSDPPAVSFVVTSDGNLLALDARDRLAWTLDLEKVVEDSNEEDEEEDDDDDEEVLAPGPRSVWFYAAGFLQENSPDATDDRDGDDRIAGMDLGSEGGLHLTCLSRAGHVVSVDAARAAASGSRGGVPEDAGECIGSFENGLRCGGWSPDGEVLALVTFAGDDDDDGNGNETENDADVRVPILMTMNTQYEILSEERLDPCLFPSCSDDSDASLHPNANAISLCWRPDSSSLAVSAVDANDGKPLRRIRTYHRTTLQILSLSKEEDGSGRDVPNLLPTAPAWAPAGCSHYVGMLQSSRPPGARGARARRASTQVAFTEPNGLRHTMCKIHNTNSAKTDSEDVTGIAFNLEGDLLAVTSRVASTKNGRHGKVQFYHRSNYHWYLKYELRYDGGAGRSPADVSAIQFSDEDPYRIAVALDRRGRGGFAAEWREYTFRWEPSTVRVHGSSSSSLSSVLAMAIDGKKLNFTPLDRAVIPPPMCAASLDLPAPAVGIAARPRFHDEAAAEGRPDFVVALSDGRLALLRSNDGGDGGNGASPAPGFRPPSLLAVVDPCDTDEPGETLDRGFSLKGATLRDVTIVDADENSLTVIAVSCPMATAEKHHSADDLVEMRITWGDAEGPVAAADVTITCVLPLEGRGLRVANWSDADRSPGARGGALVQLADGTLLEYSRGGALAPCDAGPLLEPCPWMAGVYDAADDAAAAADDGADGDIPRWDDGPPGRLVFGLSPRHRLYCGERLLSSASSSFAASLAHGFLAHVTIGSRPQLRFLPLAGLRDHDPLAGSEEGAGALDGYEPRGVERGARLVAVFPDGPTAVIQMPRGNLECISPRALVLPYVMAKIQGGDFRTALDIMRRQRVDMNLMVDFDPVDFLEEGGAERFIGQIENIDRINLFLSSLIDVDTTIWKYPVPSWIRAVQGTSAVPSHNAEGQSKVNRVCRKVREVMLRAEKDGATSSGKIVGEGHFLLPMLSTFAKENPPRLEEALSLIRDSAPIGSKRSSTKSILLSERVQGNVKYLAFLASYELLFDTAIGMYDFDLARAVARHSQMDPKAYLPMLKRWGELPEDAARYEVDVRLKRYESALRHLVASGRVEAEPFAEDHFGRCLKFVEEHSLHKLGLELFEDDRAGRRSVMVSLGERLLSERKSEEATTVFLAASPPHLDGGKRASRACGDWRTYFACCAEDGDAVDHDAVAAVADFVSSKVCTAPEQRENCVSAASILLDYGEDVAGAVDMLVSARSWAEGRRIALLHDRTDLAKRVVDGAVSHARATVEDLAERASTFETANARYAQVVAIRRDAIREAEEAGAVDGDDDASMFSVQSAASNASLRSSASGASAGSVGSVGSVASVSTVISVGATSTFSFTGDIDLNKHKSKFNSLGRGKKKKKKPKKRGVKRRKPGSEEELTELVATLGYTCPDEHLVSVVGETITFLLQSDKRSMATLLFESYVELSEAVARSQNARIERDGRERDERERRERKEGRMNDFVEHPCEKKIDAVACKPLQESVRNTFSFLL